MLLAIDIGNSNITCGIFQDRTLAGTFRIRTILDKTADEYAVLMDALLRRKGVAPEAVTAVCLASVVPPLTQAFVDYARDYLGLDCLVVDAGTRTGVKIRYEAPREIGADRIVDAAAVQALYRTPACIVDFGTATTFDALNAQGEYLGGSIVPGVQIAAQALFSRTSKLPRVDLSRPPSVIGRNTTHAIQSGLLFGYTSLVEGMVARIKAELGADTQVIATGGLADLISRETKVFDVVDPWLTLQGLRIIHELNQTGRDTHEARSPREPGAAGGQGRQP